MFVVKMSFVFNSCTTEEILTVYTVMTLPVFDGCGEGGESTLKSVSKADCYLVGNSQTPDSFNYFSSRGSAMFGDGAHFYTPELKEMQCVRSLEKIPG